jgi:perosamine synthetase
MTMQVTASPGRAIMGARPYFHEEDMPEILERLGSVLRGGRLILGPNTKELEESFRRRVGTEHAVCVSSCTAALEITLRFFGVRDREVILPTNTFAAVVNAVVYAGGHPVLAETDPHTFNLDTDDALRRINERTAGIILVHTAGLISPDLDRLRQTCRARNLFLLEDGSHAHGASINGRHAGSLTDAACFSFYPTKIMTTGTGGIITTDESSLAAYARSLRHHGQGTSLEDITNMGSDWCMNELSAVLGIYQLKRLGENVEHRRRVAGWYREQLREIDWIEIPAYSDHVRHAYYKLPVLLAEGIDKHRLQAILLEEEKIEIGSIYDPPCHLQPVFQKKFGWHAGLFPQTERILSRQTCLPMHALISEDDVEGVVAVLKQVVDRCRA